MTFFVNKWINWKFQLLLLLITIGFVRKKTKRRLSFFLVVFTPKTRENSKLKAIIREI
jgi:hypothetical protein